MGVSKEQLNECLTITKQYIDDKIGSSGGSSANYSYEEQLTGGTWVDGKPIYRKVIDFGELPNSTTKAVEHGIQNIDTIVNIGGRVETSAHYTLMLDHAHPAGLAYQWVFQCTPTDVIMITKNNFAGYYAMVVLDYTKTTDS